jgi:hypothetical protein
MADFCQACGVDVWGRDMKDLAGLVTPADVLAGKVAAVLCEGCGPTLVDEHGRCLHDDCLGRGNPGHGRVPYQSPAGPPDPVDVARLAELFPEAGRGAPG